MKAGVVIFPGSNCDQDLIEVLSSYTKSVEKLWHKDSDLKGCTHVFLPGGFSYGDYLRSGAIARLSPIMQSVSSFAKSGGFVMGICNGFQILCEAGLLPGALLRNTNMKFVCENVYLVPANLNTSLTSELSAGEVLKVPVAHGEGRFYCGKDELEQLENNGQVIFRYSSESGVVSDSANPNGSLNHIAGISNPSFNVFGMMPHPERCAMPHVFNQDGRKIFDSVFSGILV